MQGDVTSTEVFDSKGKKLPVRTVPVGRTLFCLPPVDADSERGQIDVMKYDCRPLAYLPEGTLIKTEGEDPCRVTGYGELKCW
jgi:hypothetical protein